LKERDLSIRFNSILLDRKYQEKQGTMYSLMRAGDADQMTVPIIKQRALYLKNASNVLLPENSPPVDNAELQHGHKNYGPVALQQKNNDDERN
jgi:hypothetical protein